MKVWWKFIFIWITLSTLGIDLPTTDAFSWGYLSYRMVLR